MKLTKTTTGQLFDRAKKYQPQLTNEKIVSVWEYNLDKEEPRGLKDGFVIITDDRLTVYENDTEILSDSLSNIKEFRFLSGVGCVFAECIRKDGETVLISRANAALKNRIATAIKAANHYILYGSHAFEKYFPADNVCPKCGRAYRQGSETCLNCIDTKRMAKRLWDVAKPYKWLIFASMALFVFISLLGLVTPILTRYLTNDFILSDTPETIRALDYLGVIALILLTQLASRGLSSIRNWTLVIAGNKVVHNLRGIVFEKIQRLSIARISKRTSGELMNRVSSDTARIRMFLVNQIPRLLEQILLFLVVGIAFFVYDWRLALLIILPTPLIALAFSLFRGIMGKLFRRSWERSAQSNAVLHDIFSGIRVVKSYGTEHREAQRFEAYAKAEKETQLKIETKWAWINPLLQFFISFGEFFILFYVGNAIIGGTMELADMAMFSSYAGMLYTPLQFLAGFPRQIMMAMTSVTKVFEIIDEPEDIVDAKDAKDIEIKGEVSIKNVSFGYDESVDVLRNINLDIKPGEFIGLVGKSGTGKSTLINLVMRMYEVDEGSISIDGVDIRDISQESLRSQIGVVLQETFLFNGSIYDNIAYAKKNATREEVIAAAKAAGAHSFIIKLTDGYDTYVGEKGGTLSGGERQRIAIARALLHNPKLLILDEATASLDTETEKQIQDSLAKLSHERTTIAIAHRLSTLRNATKLVVIDKGTIAEMGTHDELIEKHGIYYNLVMAQREMSKMA
ncbi:MAG: ABC transporter ATP-binding protein [Clostridia bacterium]|nr:ABC transporter ATP-binding protein [Clostridia bacterium]